MRELYLARRNVCVGTKKGEKALLGPGLFLRMHFARGGARREDARKEFLVFTLLSGTRGHRQVEITDELVRKGLGIEQARKIRDSGKITNNVALEKLKSHIRKLEPPTPTSYSFSP